MGQIVPPVYVEPAALEPHRFGLFSIAQMPTLLPDRWQAGIEWEPVWGGTAERRVYACPVDAPDFVTISAETNVREAQPFLAVAAYVCPPVGRTLDQAEVRARQYLLAGEERAVEAEIVSGAAGSQALSDEAVDVTPTAGTAVPLTVGIQLLEQALYAGHGSVPAIMGEAGLAARAGFDSVVSRQGQHLETTLGSYVGFGAGFADAAGPSYAPAPGPGEAWLYGFGRPTVYRGDVWVQPDEDNFLNRDNNEVVVLAHRPYVVTWSAPVFAVLVDAAACGCVGTVV